VISHIYLATLANPGTLQVMISGKVGKTWARHHHPLWWQELQDRDSAATRVAKR
jgi:formate dehydrogenase subunit gamma